VIITGQKTERKGGRGLWKEGGLRRRKEEENLMWRAVER
jgi:hypothetical protein